VRLGILPCRNGKTETDPLVSASSLVMFQSGESNSTGFLKSPRNFSAMMRVHANREGLSGDDLAAIGERI